MFCYAGKVAEEVGVTPPDTERTGSSNGGKSGEDRTLGLEDGDRWS